jgi:hypothetical protein
VRRLPLRHGRDRDDVVPGTPVPYSGSIVLELSLAIRTKTSARLSQIPALIVKPGFPLASSS